ncbi:class I SAM-dependent methyltransferase [Streptomyces sp. CL12]|uniref:class I SAM-dependent methyltransferase n=1 Tax=Streptomyces sp. CL12 TaxID=3391744 RepID=UPI003A8096BC
MNINVLHEAQTPHYWNALYDSGYKVDPPSDFECQMLRAYTGAESGMRVLDIGCGLGELSARMAGWGMRVTGLDFSESAVTVARKEHAEFGLLDFHLYDVTAPYPIFPDPGPVDIVVCRLSWEFVAGPRFVANVRRWLRPGGVLHILTPVSELVPEGVAHRGMPRACIAELSADWRHMTSYYVTQAGSLVGVVLRN